MAHRGQKRTLRFAGRLGSFLCFTELLFEVLALTNIDDDGRNQNPFLGVQKIQTDLHRYFAAILAQCVQFHTSSHRSYVGIFEKTLSLTRMFGTKSLW